MKIGIACDHGAFEYKEYIKQMLIEKGYEIIDFGTHSCDSCDYPDFAKLCAQSVANQECERGIVICGTGIGVSIVANKIKGIRCALCNDVVSARLTREHNDSNVLALGQRVLGIEIMKEIVSTWLDTPFSNDDRHMRRIEKISQIEESMK